MSTFQLEKKISSCEVSKDLLRQLEDYLISQGEQITGLDQGKVLEDYSISISENLGVEEFSTIRDYIPSIFSDTTTDIYIKLRIYRSHTNKPLSITLAFRKERSSRITIEHTGDNARETVVGLFDGIMRLINPHENTNWIFHPPAFVEGMLWMLSYLSFLASLYLIGKNYGILTTIIIVLFFVLLLYTQVAKRVKPYVSFESKLTLRMKRFSNWLFYGILGSILFGVILAALRNKLLGF